MRAVASITPSEAALAACPRLGRSGPQCEPPAEPPPGRALVPVGPSQGAAIDPAGSRPSAVFLAQLIATAQQAPQTRQRRRAEPTEASAVYEAGSVPAARTGRAVCRSM
jgi:hypothetical protein